MEVPKVITKETIAKYMFNAQLLLEGYAQPYTLQPDSKYEDIFVEFAREAIEKEKGLWEINPDCRFKARFYLYDNYNRKI